MRTINEINTKFLADEKKLDFYGTIGADGWPHITVLNSILKLDDETLVWGQFCHGLSKENQLLNHKVGFLMLTPDRQILSGNADWLESKTSGTEFDMYNSIPRYRYNSYFGYSPVHYLRLSELHDPYRLDAETGKKAQADSEVAARSYVAANPNPEVVGLRTRGYLTDPSAFKVLAYIDANGYPRLLPLPQASLTATNHLVFVTTPDSEVLLGLAGTQVALYAITLGQMFSVLVKGTLQRQELNGKSLGLVEIEQVYNPMMPKSGYLYPKPKLEQTREFEDVVYEFNV
jgi:hypothetical protein